MFIPSVNKNSVSIKKWFSISNITTLMDITDDKTLVQRTNAAKLNGRLWLTLNYFRFKNIAFEID